MNLYGLPEFVAYSMLLGIAYVLIVQNKEERLRYWLAGWTLIFLHSAIFMLFVQVFPFDVLGRGTLILAGQAFILAAFHQRSTTIHRSRFFWRGGLSAAANLTFAIASAAFASLRATAEHAGPFYLLIGLGAASAVWLAAADKSKSERHFRLSVGLTVLVYGIQAACLCFYGIVMASQWMMCWTYLAVAYFFVVRGEKLTLGVAFTALSFALWGLVFPVYSLLALYAPEISGRVESEVWNLPKFLAAASMILVLLEENVASAIRLGTHDELTGLPNRRLYVDRFEQAVAHATRKGSRFGLLIIDLNKFKLVNDSLGHQAGDELLKQVSARFRSVLRRSDTLARTGGDEFTVIVDAVHGAAEAESVVDALEKSLEAPIVLGGEPYFASASVGWAVYPDERTSQTSLQALADERMYARKLRHHSLAPKPRYPTDAVIATSRLVSLAHSRS